MDYEDEPMWTVDSDGNGCLAGKVPVHNLQTYLTRNPSVALVILKEYACPGISRKSTFYPNFAWPDISVRQERLRLLSPKLLRALNQVARFQFRDEDHGFPRSPSTGPGISLDAPYEFLFHHRENLATLATESDEFRDVLQPLLEFLEANYKVEYEDAEDQFIRGIVTARHFSKLFTPNQVVVSLPLDRHSVIESYVLTKYVHRKYVQGVGTKLSLVGWSWKYNGSELQREPWQGFIEAVDDVGTSIANMQVHPAKYSSPENVALLKARGATFWGTRSQGFRSYTGWDRVNAHYYVSYCLPILHSIFPTTYWPI
jgi:hypothetical protein